MNTLMLRKQLQAFFEEDLGEGDLTSEALFNENDTATGIFTAKSDGIFAGTDVFKEGYLLIDNSIVLTPYLTDGDVVVKGQDLFKVKGPVQKLLSAERVLLNLVQRMSGIATMTREAVTRLSDPSIKLTDTRKTTPGLRMMEKYAVTCGGGYNHRRGLYDAIMIKDNHIAHAGTIRKAVEQARRVSGHTVKIEVETTTREEVLEAVNAGADIIMFDNCTPEIIKEWAQLVPPSIVTEASGGISLETIHLYRNTGVDVISLGCLTHSYKAMDLSFNLGKIAAVHI